MTMFMAFGVAVGRLLLLALLGAATPGHSITAAPGGAARFTAAGHATSQTAGGGSPARSWSKDFLPAIGPAQFGTERGYATSFGGSDDQLAGGALACNGRNMRVSDRICAHRTLPCGTVVMVQNLRTKKVATCVVLDRGPYGAELPNGEIVLKLKAAEEGEWRSLIDLSPSVATAIGLTGRERVTLIYHNSRPRDPRRDRAGDPRHRADLLPLLPLVMASARQP